jgi:hypothetical protein
MEPHSSDTALAELSLAQLLADPLVQLAMNADGIRPEQVIALLNSAKQRRHQTRESAHWHSAGTAHWQGLLASNSLPREARLMKAMDSVRQAKLALRQAERRFDRDRTCESGTLIHQVRIAEATLQAARAKLIKLEPGTLDEGGTAPGPRAIGRS